MIKRSTNISNQAQHQQFIQLKLTIIINKLKHYSHKSLISPSSTLLLIKFLSIYYLSSIMQNLLQQNRRLKQIMQKCQQEIIDLKKIGHDHEQQIDNLLKFNQRLLSIIQNQMPNKVLSRTSSGSNLHPIDQMNQKQHENIVQPHRFTTQSHPIKDKVEHVDVQQIQKLSDQGDEDEFKKHVNLPLNTGNRQDQKSSSDGFGRFRYVDSYDTKPQRPDLSSGRNSVQHQQQNVIYRQEKQSLIEIPKFFKLQKGLNDHYTKQLFQSVQQFRQPGNNNIMPPPALNRFSNNNNNRKQSFPSQSSQMNKISQAVTERLLMNEQQLKDQYIVIRQLINQYKEDFDTKQYTHLCTIIKNDLQNDLKELLAVNNEGMKFYLAKQKELNKLRSAINQFSPVQKLVEIIRKLNVSEDTERMILEKITPNSIKVAVNGGVRK